MNRLWERVYSRLFIGRTDAEAKAPILWPPDEPTHLKRPWCWESLKAGGEGDDSGWDGWMASSTQWIWVWAVSGRWWWTRKPGMLQSMGSQRVGHDWATEQQQPLLPLCPRLFSMSALQIRLWARGEESHRGWDGWMASLTQWTWAWAISWRWWRTRKPGVLHSTGSQNVRHDWVTEK